jgi:hypothetical protein
MRLDLDRFLHWVRHDLRTHKTGGVLTPPEQKAVTEMYEHGLSLQFATRWVIQYRRALIRLSR